MHRDAPGLKLLAQFVKCFPLSPKSTESPSHRSERQESPPHSADRLLGAPRTGHTSPDQEDVTHLVLTDSSRGSKPLRPTTPFPSGPQGARPSSAESGARTDALPSLGVCRGDREEWNRLQPSRTRWASEKPTGGARPTGSSHKELQNQTRKRQLSKSRHGTARERDSDWGEGHREKRNAQGVRRIRGRWEGVRGAADPDGPAPSTMPSAQLHPRAARPTPACAPQARCSPKRRGCSGPGRLPAASSLRAAPGTRGFGFQPSEPRFAPPAGSTRPPGPEQDRVTLRRSRSASRRSP